MFENRIAEIDEGPWNEDAPEDFGDAEWGLTG